MADPDLQIGEGSGHPDPAIREGRWRSPKKLFRPVWPQFGLTILGGGGAGAPPPPPRAPPLDLPL